MHQLLSRLLGGGSRAEDGEERLALLGAGLLAAIEERFLWSRFGL